MHRLIVCAFAVVSLNSFGAEGPASSSKDNIPSFLRVVYGENHPEVSVQCFEESTPDSYFGYGRERLTCVLVGHANPDVRKQILNAAEQQYEDYCLRSESFRIVGSLHKDALKCLSVEELVNPTQLSLAALSISCNRREHSRSMIDASVRDGKAWFVLEKTEMHREDGPILRCPAEFMGNECIQELLCREEAGECDQSVITDAFRKLIEEEKSIGFEIDHEGLGTYFAGRIAASRDQARL